MGSFIDAFMRLTFKRKSRDGHTRRDEENVVVAAPVSSSPPPPPPPPRTDSPHSSSSQHSQTHEQPLPPEIYGMPNDHRLAIFRMMLGITAAPQLGFIRADPTARSRPADNLGLYARVVRAEEKAKDSFKVYSTVINGCYFTQVVVAAILTCMGAASGNRGITAFGAINAVMAGFLTFLKGSGLPGHLKYYGDEWKKIREYIEQRERDFSRVGCALDVYEVVAVVERMYVLAKQEIEMNTPDSYTSVARPQGGGGGGGEKNGAASAGLAPVRTLTGSTANRRVRGGARNLADPMDAGLEDDGDNDVERPRTGAGAAGSHAQIMRQVRESAKKAANQADEIMEGVGGADGGD